MQMDWQMELHFIMLEQSLTGTLSACRKITFKTSSFGQNIKLINTAAGVEK